MTVSPNRPQDGNRPFTGTPAESDDRLLSPALPPTLFALPNLNAPADNEPVPDTPESSPSTASATGTSPVNTHLPATETTVDHAASSVASTSAPVTESQSTPDSPAGRGWMEKIGAHTLVLLMLVIVVAAALLTRESKDNLPSSTPALSELAEDSFDIGVGIASTELPIPPHSPAAALDAPESFASVVAAKPVTESSNPVVALEDSSSIEASPASTRTPTAYSPDPTAYSPDPTAYTPDPTAYTPDPTAYTPDPDAYTPAKIQTNPLFLEPALADLTSDDGSSTESTLALDLTDGSSSGHRHTKTPLGINDWSRFIPPLDDETAALPFDAAGATPNP